MGSYYDGNRDSNTYLSSPVENAARHGYKAFSCSPTVSTAQTLTAGTVYVFRIDLSENITVSTVTTILQATGSGTTGAFVSIHGEDRVKLVESADLGTAWNTGTTKQNALASSVTLTGGPGRFCFVCLLAIGGTGPAMLRTGAGLSAAVNLGVDSSNAFYGATGGTGQSTIPTTPSLTGLGYKIFLALT